MTRRTESFIVTEGMPTRHHGIIPLLHIDIERSTLSWYRDSLRVLSHVPKDQARESWQTDLTDPRKHDPQDFRYVVHSLQGPGGRALQYLHLLDRPRMFDRTQAIDLFRRPERIAEKRVLSASVIDGEHQGTWGDVGYILDVPFDNVVAAYRRDTGTPFIDPERALSERERTPTIGEILKATHPQSYNEIVLRGSTAAGKVSVVGIWAKIFSDGEPMNDPMYQELVSQASRLGLSFIELIERLQPYPDCPPELLGGWTAEPPGNKHSIAVNRNGLRYLITFQDREFLVIDGKHRSRRMTRDEFDFAFGIIQKELDAKSKNEYASQIELLPQQFEASSL